MKLTTENTAIVLDSTADFPDAADRFPNWRVVPLYVRFGADSYRDYVDIGPAEFYERLRGGRGAADDLAAHAAGLRRRLRGARGASSASSSSPSRPSSRGRTRAPSRRPRRRDARARDRHGDRLRRDRDARARDPAPARAAERPTRRSTSSSSRFKRETGLVFTLDTLEYLAKGGRIGRAAGWAGQLLNIKPILTLADGEVLPLKRVRGNRKAIQSSPRVRGRHRRTGRACAWGSLTPRRPTAWPRSRRSSAMSGRRREIEVATTLGPVVGTHAGPGTVGLFWFQD